MNTRSWSELFSQCVWNIPSPPHHHLLQLIFFFLNFLNPLRTTLWTRLLYIAAASTDLRCHQCINTLLLSAGRNWECLSIIIYRHSSGENEKTSNRVFDFFTATLIVHTHTRLLKFAFGKSDAVHVICFRRLLGWVDFDNLSCTRGWRFKNKWPSRPSSVSRMCVYVSVGSAETVSAFWSAFVNLLVVHSVSTQ